MDGYLNWNDYSTIRTMYYMYYVLRVLFCVIRLVYVFTTIDQKIAE